MPRQGCTHREISRLAVADLTDVDDVWILAQERAEHCREGQAAFDVDLDLIHAVHAIFDGVFYRRDIGGAIIDLLKAREQRCRLAAPGRTAAEDHAIRTL